MLVVFLLDTSASMNQRCNNGLTLLDCAKSAIEQFHKVRLRDVSVRMDRYMLVTCEERSNAIRVLDKYPFINFMHVVKGIQARDLTTIGASLQHIFSFLHLQHLATDIDKFGHGRNPCSIDPTTIMLLTDGTELTSMSGVLPTVSQTLLPSTPAPVGAELVMQPFRWDQRVFATILRIPSVSEAVLEKNNGISHHAVAMDNTISALCESTGGKSFVATSWKLMLQHIELMAARLASSVIITFEQALPSGSTAIPQGNASLQRKVMFVRGGQMQGHWPIPEGYWTEPLHPELQPREPHPVISYKSTDSDPYIPLKFVYDKYEIENNPFMNLAHKGSVGACWQVFIRNSKGLNHGFGDPFGFIRLNHGGSLTLIVLPYNYPVLWQLLKQVVKVPGSTTAKIPLNPQWRQDMERYCASIPAYYGSPLRAALKKWGLQAHTVPESMDNSWVSFVGTHLKWMKVQAKSDLDTQMSHILTDDYFIASNYALSPSIAHRSLPTIQPPSAQISDAPPGFVGSLDSLPTVQNTVVQARNLMLSDVGSMRKGWESMGSSLSGFQSLSAASLNSGPASGTGHLNGSGITNPNTGSHGGNSPKEVIFKNPFDIAKDQLIRQLINLPVRVASALQARRNYIAADKGVSKPKSSLSILAAKWSAREEEESRHSLPVEKMGDFNEALLKQQLPRNPFIEDVDRIKQQRPTFGNPYRQERNDGADEAWQEGINGPIVRGRKKRRRTEVPGLSPSSPGCTSEGILDGITGSEAAPLSKVLSDPQGMNEDLAMFGLMPHDMKSKEKLIETAEAADVILDMQGRKERNFDIYSENVDDVRKSISIEDKDKEHVKFEQGPPGEHLGLSTSTGVDNGEDSLPMGPRNVPVNMTSKAQRDPHDVADFLIAVFRTLRHTRSNNTHKLFELLSIPDFPVDKCSFLEQLIQQAYRYNRGAVAKELSDYRRHILCQAVSAVGKV